MELGIAGSSPAGVIWPIAELRLGGSAIWRLPSKSSITNLGRCPSSLCLRGLMAKAPPSDSFDWTSNGKLGGNAGSIPAAGIAAPGRNHSRSQTCGNSAAGIEPGSSAGQAEILTTKLPRSWSSKPAPVPATWHASEKAEAADARAAATNANDCRQVAA